MKIESWNRSQGHDSQTGHEAMRLTATSCLDDNREETSASTSPLLRRHGRLSAPCNVNGEIPDRLLLHVPYVISSGPLMLIRGGFVREYCAAACIVGGHMTSCRVRASYLPRALSFVVRLKVHGCRVHAWLGFGCIFNDEGKNNFTEIFGFLGHIVCFWSKRLIEVIKLKPI